MQWLRARWAWLAGAAAWLAALRLAAAAEFGLVFLIASGLVAVFINLDRSGRSKGLSAYAAFNKDGYHIPGSLRASQFEREITRDASRAREREEFRPHEEPAQPTASFRRVSKMANHPCYCGSGRKYKRCCRAVDEAADGAPPQLEVVLSDDEGAAGAARVGGRR